MIRAITVLASTLLFALFGLLVGWLNVQAQMQSIPSSNRISTDSLMFSYGVAPLTGAVLGFALSVIALRMFARHVARD